MPGFFDKLLSIGAAHARHVTAIRTALSQTDEAQAVASLSDYLRGLSEASLRGFELSVIGLAGKEADARVKQSLQWILANVDKLRTGRVQVSSRAEDRPTPEPARIERPAAPHAKASAAPGPHSVRPASARQESRLITGTWKGLMTNDDGESFEASYSFSGTGH